LKNAPHWKKYPSQIVAVFARRPAPVCREEGGSFSDSEISVRLKVNPLTVSNVRQRAHERGALACLNRQEQTTRKARKLDGAQEAQLVAIVCSTPPDGAALWSLRLVRERLIEPDSSGSNLAETTKQNREAC
jgi:transposase